MLSGTGRIAVGGLVYEVAGLAGRLRRRNDQSTPLRPRAMPAARVPLPFPELLDRERELEAVRALEADVGHTTGLELNAPPGFGKTAILRFLAGRTQSSRSPDGVVYVGRDQVRGPGDLLQTIAAEFVDGELACGPEDPELLALLEGRRALLLFDELPLTRDELDDVRARVPSCTVVVATTGPPVYGETALTLAGLPTATGVALLERELERPLSGTEREAAARICELFGGHPLSLVQTAGMAREQRASLLEVEVQLAGSAHERLVELLLASLSEPEERVLSALAAVGGASLSARRLAALAAVDPVEPVLASLRQRGLIRLEERPDRAAGIAHIGERLGQLSDLTSWTEKAVHLFVGLAGGELSPEEALEDLGAVFNLLGWADDSGRWREAIELVKVAQTGLVLARRFDAWGHALERALSASAQLQDTEVQAWALNQLGNRAALLGDRSAAKTYLKQAAKLHASTGQQAAASLARQNLAAATGRGMTRAFRETIAAVPVGVRVVAAGLIVLGVGASLAAGYARPVRGPRGPEGQAGPPGATGPQGLRGLPGKDGTAAEKGDRGRPGPPGPEGPAGADGRRGAPAVRLWAIVDEKGGLVAGPVDPSPVVSTPESTEEGVQYDVTFAGEDMSACAWVAVPTAARPPPASGAITEAETLHVVLASTTPFTLQVLC